MQWLSTLHRVPPPGLLFSRVRLVCCVALAAAVLFFTWSTWQWRLTGDSALMHYVAFLLDRGRSPYREIWDINFPGAYLPDWIFQHCFGPAPLPWRLYDLALLLLLATALLAIAGWRHWFAAAWSAGLFAVIHGRDGMEQLGQRDLSATVLLSMGFALLPAQAGCRNTLRSFGFGLCVGAASTVKPIFALFLLLILWRKPLRSTARLLLPALSGFLLPWAVCLIWLWRHGSLAAFLFTLRVLLPFHASLGHVRLGTLLYKSVSPALPLVALWLLVCLYTRLKLSLPAHDFALRQRLALASLLGLLCFAFQGKAFPYQRYPLLAFLLLLIGLDLTRWLASTVPTRWPAALALGWGALYLAPASALKASHYDWQSEQFTRQLSLRLKELGVSSNPHSPSVLCLDTVSGCLNVLEDLQVPQSTPNLYDEFLLTPQSAPAITSSRLRFFAQVRTLPPGLIVVTNRTFPAGVDGYSKLASWPAFDDWLNARYCLAADWTPPHQVRWMGRYVTPASFRIYGQRVTSSCATPPSTSLTKPQNGKGASSL